MILPRLNLDFYHRLSKRERVLLLLVGGTVFFILNLVALRTLVVSFRDLGQQRAAKADELQTDRVFIEDKPTWQKRMEWLRAHQPALANRTDAEAKMQERIKTLADQNKIVLTNPQMLPASAATRGANPDYQEVVFQVSAKSTWPDMVRFVHAVQQPEEFTVFQSANLSTDGKDKTTIKASFRISKWYAPTGK